MENPGRADTQQAEQLVAYDIVSLLAMLDYLVVEVAKVDALSAQGLLLARKSLVESVAGLLVWAH
jgi:hypothetical protein